MIQCMAIFYKKHPNFYNTSRQQSYIDGAGDRIFPLCIVCTACLKLSALAERPLTLLLACMEK